MLSRRSSMGWLGGAIVTLIVMGVLLSAVGCGGGASTPPGEEEEAQAQRLPK